MTKQFFLIIAAATAVMCASSCGVLDFGTTVKQGAEVINEHYTTKGTYIGTASSYSEAQSLARDRGYTHFNWYQGTGDVYGYNQ